MSMCVPTAVLALLTMAILLQVLSVEGRREAVGCSHPKENEAETEAIALSHRQCIYHFGTKGTISR